MFISFDNGSHWQSFQLNLPNVPVSDIKVHRKDLVVSTQGRAFWILDNITSLHQLTSRTSSSEVHLFKPRDGYRTRANANVLGPNIEYFLRSTPTGTVTIEILDAKGSLINSYDSNAPAPVRGGRGGGEQQPEDPDAAPAGGRGRATPPPRVTKLAGLNRFVWDVRHQVGVTVPPGQYQARLKVDATTLTEPFNVLIDPRVAEDGVTTADLQEQFEHNKRMRELVNSVNQIAAKVRDAQAKQRNEAGTDGGDLARRLEAIAAKLFTPSIRYSKPGLQAHITYLAGMTANIDQKIGRDAIERYEVLRKELDEIKAELDRVLH
jgi:hypothetical protein